MNVKLVLKAQRYDKRNQELVYTQLPIKSYLILRQDEIMLILAVSFMHKYLRKEQQIWHKKESTPKLKSKLKPY